MVNDGTMNLAIGIWVVKTKGDNYAYMGKGTYGSKRGRPPKKNKMKKKKKKK